LPSTEGQDDFKSLKLFDEDVANDIIEKTKKRGKVVTESEVAEMLQKVKERRIRPHSLPTTWLLSEKQLIELEEVLKQEKFAKLGLTIHSPLKDFIALHEKFSEDILRAAGFEKEALLAGNHHMKEGQATSLTAEALDGFVEFAEVLHLTDMLDALNSARSYKDKFPLLETLSILVKEADSDRIKNKGIAYLIIADEYESRKKEIIYPLTQEQRQWELEIQRYFKKYSGETLKWQEYLKPPLAKAA